MLLSVLESIILLGGFHGIVVALIIAFGAKTRAIVANKYLAVFIGAFSVLVVRNIFEAQGVLPVFSYLSLLSNALIPLLGPAIYHYVVLLYGQKSSVNRRDQLHLLPFVVYLVLIHIVSAMGIGSHQELQSFSPLFWLVNVLQVLVALLLIAYITLSIRVLVLTNRKMKDNYSCLAKLGVNWLVFLLVSIAVITGVWNLVFAADIVVLKPHQSKLTLELFWLTMSLLIYSIGYYGMLVPEVLSINPDTLTIKKTEQLISKDKMPGTVEPT